PSINRANEADSGGHVSLGAKCQAPIRSRRRSSGGGGRHNIRRSDHLVDRKSMSQPVASPGTNRSGRTSPPRETFSVRKSRGLVFCFGRTLRGCPAIGSLAEVARRAGDRLLWPRFG